MTSRPTPASQMPAVQAAAPTTPLRTLAVVPARLASQRLPRKMLREIAGKPLLCWTVEAARRCPQFNDVIVATDSEEIAGLCEARGWLYRMTSPSLPSGTDRLFAVSQEIDADLYVNVQGDEPLVTERHIAGLLAPFQHLAVDVTTLKIRCKEEEVHDPNAVKVVTSCSGRGLYFSRAAIPFDRSGTGHVQYFKHLGLYAYRRAALQRFASLEPSSLEQIEKLEQLRLLENGLSIYVTETDEPTVGVDTEQDLQKVEALLLQRLA